MTATATDVITVRPAADGAGSEITYDATVVLHGVQGLDAVAEAPNDQDRRG